MSVESGNGEGVMFRVIGVGDAGCRTVDLLHRTNPLPGVEVALVNSDQAALALCGAPAQMCIGHTVTRGLGAGGDLRQGRSAAEADSACLKALSDGARMVFVVAGMGGGLGTGAAPIVARLARESGALVLAVVTLPFEFEGSLRQSNAAVGLEALRAEADAVICLPCKSFRQLLDERTTAVQAFEGVQEHLAGVVRGVWQLLTRPGLMRLDFSSLETLLKNGHFSSVFATVECRGEMKSREAVDRILAHPLLENGRALGEADGILLGIAGGAELGLGEIERVTRELARHYRDGIPVMVGTAVDDALGDTLEITLIAIRKASMPTMAEGRASEASGDAVAATGFEPSEDFSRQADGEESSEAGRVGSAPLLGTNGERRRKGVSSGPSGVGLNATTAESGNRAPMHVAGLGRTLGRGNARRGARPRGKGQQQELNLFTTSRGLFENTQATVFDNENLDEPTFVRRNIALN